MNNEDKPIGFTTHARKRLEERGITEDEAIEVIHKGKSGGWRDGKQILEYKSSILVVDKKKDNIIQVITVYKSNKTLEQKIKKIPAPHDWWHKTSKKAFINQAYFLLEKGLTQDEIMPLLEDLYKAVCAEFGEEYESLTISKKA